jgi:hypothetical protein
MDMGEFNILVKPKLLHFKLSSFDRKTVFLLLICMQSIYAIIKMVSEKTCFLGVLLKLLKWISYTIIVKQRIVFKSRQVEIRLHANQFF